MHIPRITETVRGAPQQLFPIIVHELLDERHNFVQTGIALSQGIAFRRDVPVVKAKVLNPQLIEDFKTGIGLVFVDIHSIGCPKAFVGRAGAEHVLTVAAKRVPIGYGKLELLAHGLATDDLLGVVVPKREGVC